MEGVGNAPSENLYLHSVLIIKFNHHATKHRGELPLPCSEASLEHTPTFTCGFWYEVRALEENMPSCYSVASTMNHCQCCALIITHKTTLMDTLKHSEALLRYPQQTLLMKHWNFLSICPDSWVDFSMDIDLKMMGRSGMVNIWFITWVHFRQSCYTWILFWCREIRPSEFQVIKSQL